jgi:hypothetical protein
MGEEERAQAQRLPFGPPPEMLIVNLFTVALPGNIASIGHSVNTPFCSRLPAHSVRHTSLCAEAVRLLLS